jgi:predicted nucleic acid-binding protein
VRRFVVDSSVSLAWCFADESDVYAEATLRELGSAEARVPGLWPYEVANALLMGERRGRLTPADTRRALDDLDDLPIHVDVTGHQRGRREVLELARQEGLTVYDAAYLDLAMRERVPLATLDGDLREAAARVGVPLFTPGAEEP